MDHHGYIPDLAIVLGVAAATSILFRLLKQPSILGYLLAGLIVGPYLPIPLFADADRVLALSEFGVVLVMFVIGLEFRIRKLFHVVPVAGFTVLLQIGVLLWSGYMVGQGLGWSRLQGIFLGASIAISSTMVVSKLFEEKPVSKDLRSFVLGILVLQDVAAIALIGAMTAIAETGSFSPTALAITAGKLALTLLVFTAGGLLFVPRLVRTVARLKNKETMVVTVMGICFGFSLLAESQGYSVALGAFVAGVLVGESGSGYQVERLIHPVKDMFAAIFFVAIGMTVDPRLAMTTLDTALLVFGVVVLGQFVSVSVGGILSGIGLRLAMTASLSLGQIGEFAFIIAGIGVAAGVASPELQPVLVTVAVLTAFTTPLALGRSKNIVTFVDHHMPRRIRTILVVYESWFEKLRKARSVKNPSSPTRIALRAIVLDAALWIGLLAVGFLWSEEIMAWMEHQLGLPQAWKFSAFIGLLILVSVLPLWGVIRNTQHLVLHLSQLLQRVRSRSGIEMSEKGQAFLRSTIWLAVILGVGIPATALLRPLSGMGGISLLLLVSCLIAVIFLWQSAVRFDKQIRSEAERFVGFLSKQAANQTTQAPQPFFPDMENMVALEVEPGALCVGMSLMQLNLRATTGALIVTIHRKDGDIGFPTGSEIIREGDLLMVTGTSNAMSRAREAVNQKKAEEPTQKDG